MLTLHAFDIGRASNSSIEARRRERERRDRSQGKSGRKDGSIVVHSVPLTQRFFDKTIERYVQDGRIKAGRVLDLSMDAFARCSLAITQPIQEKSTGEGGRG